MKKSPILPAGVLALMCFAVQTAGAAEPAPQPKIVLISGEYEYRSAETLPELKQTLQTSYGFNCVYLERTKGEDIPGLDALDKADLVILFVRRMTLPEAQLVQFKKYLDSGKPLIGLRTASHAFENWAEFDHEVLGGNYHMHYGDKLIATISMVPEAADHPILNGVEKEFVAGGSLYRNAPLPRSSAVLLTGSVNNQAPEPVAWTHSYRGARIFYTSLGHPKDFENPSFKRMLVNAVFWTLKRPVPSASVGSQKPDARNTRRRDDSAPAQCGWPAGITAATSFGRRIRCPSSPATGQSTIGCEHSRVPSGSRRKCDSVRPGFWPLQSPRPRWSAA